MSVFHDEVEIEDFEYEEETETYFYPCPCGDNFVITKEELTLRLRATKVCGEHSVQSDRFLALLYEKEDLENGEEVATCPSCSLVIKVIYDRDQFMCGETVSVPSTSKELVKC
ncbi:diphthamide biosynthesis protein 3 isoform X1 [Phascolarctos cinereus]|uniref:Diphthamide biosynthesis protein 3 n=1 Tax=Phascolarctos cinereus TaxID=38626 RepID=A0A6P5KCZ9_PHACI|nr:DPH3 homolog isoform X1 [Phascolarctos cinereus]